MNIQEALDIAFSPDVRVFTDESGVIRRIEPLTRAANGKRISAWQGYDLDLAMESVHGLTWEIRDYKEDSNI